MKPAFEEFCLPVRVLLCTHFCLENVLITKPFVDYRPKNLRMSLFLGEQIMSVSLGLLNTEAQVRKTCHLRSSTSKLLVANMDRESELFAPVWARLSCGLVFLISFEAPLKP